MVLKGVSHGCGSREMSIPGKALLCIGAELAQDLQL